MAESEQELKSLLMKVKVESEKVGLKTFSLLHTQKGKNQDDSRNSKKLSQHGMATSCNFSLSVKSACLDNLTGNSESSVARQHSA